MSLNCKDIRAVLGCWNDPVSGPTPVIIYTEFRDNASGNPVPHAVRFTLADGTPVAASPADVTPGLCSSSVSPSYPSVDCAGNDALRISAVTCDRLYTDRASGLVAGAYTIPNLAPIRSYTLIVPRDVVVTRTDGPDAGVAFPAGSYSWSAPNNGQGAERGLLPSPISFNSLGQYMVIWTEG